MNILMFTIKQQACAANLHSNSTKQLLQFVRCTVQHEDWKTNPSKSGSECINQVDDWFDEWPQIEMCAHLNDTTDIDIFLLMKNKTEQLDPPLSKGLLKRIISFITQKKF